VRGKAQLGALGYPTFAYPHATQTSAAAAEFPHPPPPPSVNIRASRLLSNRDSSHKSCQDSNPKLRNIAPSPRNSKMAKRKRNAAHITAVKKPATNSIPSPPVDANLLEPSNVHSVVSYEEIEVSVETLQALTAYPNLIKSKACKDLRTAVYGFRQACTTGLNSAGEFWNTICKR
jgi:hypothetical protein